MKRSLQAILLASVSCAVLLGCSSASSKVTPPPAKPLGPAEEAVLKQIEALPPNKRVEYLDKNLGVVLSLARRNKTFQDRLNEISRSGK